MVKWIIVIVVVCFDLWLIQYIARKTKPAARKKRLEFGATALPNESNRLKIHARYHSPPSNYDTYLESVHWKELSRRMRRERGRCELCSGPAEQVHHLHYETLGYEGLDDVIVLCERCHSKIHGRM